MVKTFDPKKLARKGQAYYDRVLRSKLEPKHKGKYLILDVETGEYEMDADELAALDRYEAKHSGHLCYVIRVGYPVSGSIGVNWEGRGA